MQLINNKEVIRIYIDKKRAGKKLRILRNILLILNIDLAAGLIIAFIGHIIYNIF